MEWPQQTKLALEYMNGHSRTTKETPLPHPTPNLAFYLIKEILVPGFHFLVAERHR